MGVLGTGVASQESQRDRAVDVGEDPPGSGPERIELAAQLVGERYACCHEVLAGAHQRSQRECLVTAQSERGEAVAVGAREFTEHHRVEAVVLRAACTEAITRGGELVGMDREHSDPGRQESADQQSVRALDRAESGLTGLQALK
jgi:hypothetical protein